MPTNLPSEYLRGLRNPQHRGSEDPTIVLAPAYYPVRSSPDHRRDGGRETSINLRDDDGAVAQLTQRQSASVCGIAVLPTEAVETLRNGEFAMNAVFVERFPIKNNPYHGNIVFLPKIAWERVKLLAAVLATKSRILE